VASHCLHVVTDGPLQTDDYDTLLPWPNGRLWQEIQRVTDAAEEADVEAEEVESA
jgi:hypothetical protein